MFYIYNDIKLPALPKKRYPYTFITCQQTVDVRYGLRIVAYVCACENPAIKVSGGVAMPKGSVYQSWRCANDAENAYNEANGKDLLPSMRDGFAIYKEEATSSGGKTSYPCIWTDHDILDSSGNVYMAASEPISPVTITRGKITYNGTPVSDEAVNRYIKVSDEPYDLQNVNSVGVQIDRYPSIFQRDDVNVEVNPYLYEQNINMTNWNFAFVRSIFRDTDELPRGTYLYSYQEFLEGSAWVYEVNGVRAIGTVLSYDGDYGDTELYGGIHVKVSDDPTNLHDVAYLMFYHPDFGQTVMASGFAVAENNGVQSITIEGLPAMLSVSKEFTDENGTTYPVGTYHLYAMGAYMDEVGFYAETGSGISSSLNYLLHGMFSKPIAHAMTGEWFALGG